MPWYGRDEDAIMLAMPTTSVVACPSGACATCECIDRSQRHCERQVHMPGLVCARATLEVIPCAAQGIQFCLLKATRIIGRFHYKHISAEDQGQCYDETGNVHHARRSWIEIHVRIVPARRFRHLCAFECAFGELAWQPGSQTAL